MGDLICIVDDDHAFRAAIARLLRLRDYQVAEYGSADDLLGDLREGVDPSCILLDVRLPGPSGLKLQEHLMDIGASFPIIFLTGYGDVPMTVKAIKAGAEDVLTKPVSARDLFDCIDRALANFQQERLKREWRKGARDLLDSLSPREREVFEYVVRGKVNKQTGYELGITERTIKAHRQRIFQKLHVKTVAELVSLAERLGALPHP